jgi:DUF4097 and DUF4098 domain-containing protein YvlB
MIRRLIPLAFAASIATPALAQQRQAAFNWQGVVAAGGDVSVNNINGDIKVTQSTTGRVEVLGFKTGDSQYFDRIKVDVQPTSRGIVVCVLYEGTDSYCDDRGYHSEGRGHNDRDWGRLAIDLEVAIPSNLQVGASSVSGDVEITGAQGDVRANSVSGDIRLANLRASSIQANTVSGDVVVRVDQFTGRGDLKFNTVSGDVTLEVPKQFDADLSMSTVSGKVDSDFQMVLTNNRMNRRSVDARIGNGGRRLDLNSVSGDLKIRMIN